MVADPLHGTETLVGHRHRKAAPNPQRGVRGSGCVPPSCTSQGHTPELRLGVELRAHKEQHFGVGRSHLPTRRLPCRRAKALSNPHWPETAAPFGSPCCFPSSDTTAPRSYSKAPRDRWPDTRMGWSNAGTGCPGRW